jgi:ubiquinone/menaquinone biosynthesis C-methylase UbiE
MRFLNPELLLRSRSIFRIPERRDPYRLPVSMAGLKLGDRVLLVACADGRFLAALASKAGLTGRACGVDDDRDRAARAAAAALEAGVHVEVEHAPYQMLPYSDDAFDLIVIRDLLPGLRPDERVGCLREAYRVVRRGGRCLVIEAAPRGGLGALFSRRGRDWYYWSSGGAVAALEAEGFRAARRLAEREGLAFIEAVKPRR